MRNAVTHAAMAAMVLLGVSGAAAQDDPPPAPPASAETSATDIEVLGQRRLEREQVVESLRIYTTRYAFTEVVPRFHSAICPRVIGVDPELSGLVEARISAVASYAGLPKPDKDCRGNAFVLILDHPPEMFETLIKERLGLIGEYQRGNQFRDLHLNAIRADLKAGKPLVAWNQIKTLLYDSPADTATKRLALEGFGRETPNASSVRSSQLQHKMVSVVVFDKKQLADIDVIQIADLASLYLLGSPRRDLDFTTLGAPSLLTLFRDGGNRAPRMLTDFDRAYLKGLYAMRPNDWGGVLHRSVLAAYERQCIEEGVPCPAETLAAGK